MSQRAIFLDRDDTIIENDGYLGDPAKVKLLPGAATALASLRALGYRLIVVSNQSGVARGMFREEDVEAVNDEMSRQLKEKAGAYIDASYYCPYHPEAVVPEYKVDHDWRKPKPGMLKQAAADFSLELAQCWMVGDAPRDIAAGAAVGCRTILLRDADKKSAAAAENLGVTPDFVVKSLTEAARIIVREGRTHPPLPPTPPAPPPPEPKIPTPPSPASNPPPVAATPAAPEARHVITPAAAVSPAPTHDLPHIAGESQRQPSAPTPPAALPGGQETLAHTINHLSPRLEKHLEDLVIQLRNQSRNADLRPDFSLSSMATILCEIFAVACCLIGVLKYLTLSASMATQADVNASFQGHYGALLWIMLAVFFQAAVIALLLYARNKDAQ